MVSENRRLMGLQECRWVSWKSQKHAFKTAEDFMMCYARSDHNQAFTWVIDVPSWFRAAGHSFNAFRSLLTQLYKIRTAWILCGSTSNIVPNQLQTDPEFMWIHVPNQLRTIPNLWILVPNQLHRMCVDPRPESTSRSRIYVDDCPESTEIPNWLNFMSIIPNQHRSRINLDPEST